MDLKELKLVVLDCAYDTITNEHTVNLLGMIARLKITSYQDRYPPDVLPVGTSDFTATHVLLCRQGATTLEPLMGYRVDTPARCKRFSLEFPLLHNVLGAPENENAILDVLREADVKRESVAYLGSWTYDSAISSNKELQQICRDCSIASFVHYFSEYKLSKAITFAVLRFNVQRFHRMIGFRQMCDASNVALPTFPCLPFYGEMVSTSIISGADEFTEYAKGLAEQYRALWDTRLVLSKETITEAEKAAA